MYCISLRFSSVSFLDTYLLCLVTIVSLFHCKLTSHHPSPYAARKSEPKVCVVFWGLSLITIKKERECNLSKEQEKALIYDRGINIKCRTKSHTIFIQVLRMLLNMRLVYSSEKQMSLFP